MATAQARKFTHAPAVRARVPLIIGIAGPSGTGKTKSGLRIADGMAKADQADKDRRGRPTFVVDTESNRALHYAGEHKFVHVPFPPPHGPSDYLDALNYCVDQGAGRVLFDSMSHEHDGEGGVLQMHKEELERLGGDMRRTFEAWAKPKQLRRTLINRLTTCGVDLILCFRADEKKQPVRGKPPIDLGFTPVSGREYMYEMAIKLLLLPGAKGVPTFRSDFPGEARAIKLPGQFEALFARSVQLSEDIGEQFARWAGGGDVVVGAAPKGLPDLLTRMGACSDQETLDQLDDEAKELYPTLNPAEQKRLNAAGKAAHTRVRMLAAQAAEAARAMAAASENEEDGDQGYSGGEPSTAAEPAA